MKVWELDGRAGKPSRNQWQQQAGGAARIICPIPVCGGERHKARSEHAFITA